MEVVAAGRFGKAQVTDATHLSERVRHVGKEITEERRSTSARNRIIAIELRGEAPPFTLLGFFR